MKKELMVGVLAMSAAMASQVAAPSFAMARSIQAEKGLPTEFKMKSVNKARVKMRDGTYVEGHIILNLSQDVVEHPYFPSLVRPEMQGGLYFLSDEDVEEYEGKKYPMYVSFTSGDDSSVILDLIHKERVDKSRTYQVYGCNSTMTECLTNPILLTVKGKEISMRATFPAWSEIEVYDDVRAGWMDSIWDMKFTL